MQSEGLGEISVCKNVRGYIVDHASIMIYRNHSKVYTSLRFIFIQLAYLCTHESSATYLECIQCVSESYIRVPDENFNAINNDENPLEMVELSWLLR